MNPSCPTDPLIVKEEDIANASSSLKAMGHPLRLKILCVLGNNEKPVLEIVEAVGTTQSNVSQHLEILRNKGIVTSRRDGSRILCKISDEKIISLIGELRNTFCTM